MYKSNEENAKDLRLILTDIQFKKASDVIAKVGRIKRKKIRFIIPLAPAPSHRPRVDANGMFYVPGAAKNNKFFSDKVYPTLKRIWVQYPCSIKLDIYVQTPPTWPKFKQFLAERKIIRPWHRVGDNDNFEKAVYDMMQPSEHRETNGILADDSLIVDNETHKYYSITPRYEVELTYVDYIPQELIDALEIRDFSERK